LIFGAAFVLAVVRCRPVQLSECSRLAADKSDSRSTGTRTSTSEEGFSGLDQRASLIVSGRFGTNDDVKKLLLLAVVVFLGFWMFTDPTGLADIAKSGSSKGWDLTTQLFTATIDFIKTLF
jgi:hypothetical protein